MYLLIPLLISTLPPEEFNRYGSLTSVLTLFTVIFTLRMHSAPARLLFDHTNIQDQEDLLFTSLTSSLLLSLFLSTLTLSICWLTNCDNVITKSDNGIRCAILLAIFGRNISEYACTYFRATGQATNFLKSTVIEGAMLLAPMIVGYWLNYNMYNVAIASFAISACAAATYGLYLNRSTLTRGRFSPKLAKECFDFSWPAAACVVSYWGLAQGGRLWGIYWFGPTYPGLASYSLLTFFISAVGIVTKAVYEGMRPEIGRSFASANFRQGTGYINLANYVGCTATLIFFTLLILTQMTFPTLVPTAFRASYYLIFLALIASILDAVTTRASSILLAIKRSQLQFYYSVVPGVIALVFLPIFCILWDTSGMLLSSVLGFGIQAAALSYVASTRLNEAISTHLLSSTPRGNWAQESS